MTVKANPEIPTAYSAQQVEGRWTEFWEERRCFVADPTADRPAFSITMPPPNVTGVLHMGHALVSTLQDIFSRWKRMQGYEVLWLPGCDHAGISTQTVVERHLLLKTGKKRSEFSREEFLEHVWSWKEHSESSIVEQLRKMGSSCDWSRWCFTMDAQKNRAVRKVFEELYNEGLIYRGDYIVNWDCVTQTAIADDEVEYEERQGNLWHFRYPFADGDEEGGAIIATTRPETLLGDVAVAVSPNDERYKSYLGRLLQLPLTDRTIPVIADHHVDPEFGSGMVKVTPAHDPNDYEIGLRHDLPRINIMTPDGRINENGGAFAGLTMEQAREAVVDAMRQLGLLVKVEPHTHRVGLSYRSKAVIEPYISKQWFVKMQPFKEMLRRAVTEGEVELVPPRFDNQYLHWIDNLRDWCISRQLWWGHRIPIWSRKDDPSVVICFGEEGVPEEVSRAPEEWEQDPDVLDTWFSSALWPFSTLGWPDKTPEFDKFYPNSLLITGHDILFFWVARMLFMGKKITGKFPFPKVFLHGLIFSKSYWKHIPGGGIQYLPAEEKRKFDTGAPLPKDVESRWEKMSKSKGNVIDPFDVIERYGTDAMRMALCTTSCQMREIDLDERRFEEFKNFANKLWNGARFVILSLTSLSDKALESPVTDSRMGLDDRWILAALNSCIKKVNASLELYQVDQAALAAYEFFWDQFCAYYVEIVKPVIARRTGSQEECETKQKVLLLVLTQCVLLLHPFVPFITEEIFLMLCNRFPTLSGSDSSCPFVRVLQPCFDAECCAMAPYPKQGNDLADDSRVEEEFESVREVVYEIRKMRNALAIPPSTRVNLSIAAEQNAPIRALLELHQEILLALIPIETLTFVDSLTSTGHGASCGVRGAIIWLEMPASLLERERDRIQKEIEGLKKAIAATKNQLENSQFVERAPPKLVAERRSQLENDELELNRLIEALQKIS